MHAPPASKIPMASPQTTEPEIENSAEQTPAADEIYNQAEVPLRATTDAEAKLRAAEARARQEAQLRAAAEAKAEQEAQLRAAAESRVAEEVRLRTEAEAHAREELKRAESEKKKAIDEAQLLIKAHAKDADFARAQAEKAIRVRIAEEKMAASEAKLEAAARLLEEAKLREQQELRLQFKAKIKSSEGVRQAETAKAQAEQEAKLRAVAEAKAAHEAKLAAIARSIAEQEVIAKVEVESKLEELSAIAAEQERLRMAAEIKASVEAKLRAEAEAKIILAAEHRAEADAKTTKETVNLRKRVKRAVRAVARAEIKASKLRKKTKLLGTPVAVADEWFYTINGNRQGPVTFEQLRAMALKSSLHPRVDMAWKTGMTSWIPSGQIQGLFESRGMPANQAPQAAPTMYPVPPASAYHPTTLSRPVGFRHHHGVGRGSMFFVALVLPFIWSFVLNIAQPHVVKWLDKPLGELVLQILGLLPIAIIIHFVLRRLLDLGMSRWWLAGLLAPFLNFWVGYRCLACPSGYAHHRKMDRSGFLVAFVYWSIVLVATIFFLTVIAPFVGVADSSDIFTPIRRMFSRFSA